VEEGRAFDWPDLPITEKPSDGDASDVFPEEAGVEVRLAIEMLAAPDAREEEGAARLSGAFSIISEHDPEVFGGGLRVADVETEAHPQLEILADGDGAPGSSSANSSMRTPTKSVVCASR
jgi:hypothetical protein